MNFIKNRQSIVQNSGKTTNIHRNPSGERIKNLRKINRKRAGTSQMQKLKNGIEIISGKLHLNFIPQKNNHNLLRLTPKNKPTLEQKENDKNEESQVINREAGFHKNESLAPEQQIVITK